MIKGRTESGFEFEIDENLADDMEILDDIAACDTDVSRFSPLLLKMLGADQKKRLYDHLRNEDGRVPVQPVIDEFIEIMNKASESLKN